MAGGTKIGVSLTHIIETFESIYIMNSSRVYLAISQRTCMHLVGQLSLPGITEVHTQTVTQKPVNANSKRGTSNKEVKGCAINRNYNY